MYPNIEAERARKGLTKEELAALFGLSAENKGAEALLKICGQIADKMRTPNAVFVLCYYHSKV